MPTPRSHEIGGLMSLARKRIGESNRVSNAIGYATFYSRSHNAVIRVYHDAGNVIETQKQKGEFKEW